MRHLARDDESVDADTTRYALGDRFGQYEITGFVGDGAMADVYEVEHVALGKRFALKMLNEACVKNKTLRQRFLDEGRRAARIRHSNVVDITDVGVVDGCPFIVMQLLEGDDLRTHLEEVGRLEVDDAIHIIVPAIAGAWAGHRQGIVHRDLKPENIHLAIEDGRRVRPTLLDFGVSMVLNEGHERLTHANAVLGTPMYMSPEQARGDDCDERSDQYTLAVVLYEMITGYLPRDADSVLQAINVAAEGLITPPSELIDIDPELERVLLTALSRDPDERFANVKELGLSLLPWAQDKVRDFWKLQLEGPDMDGPPSTSGEHLISDPPTITLDGSLRGSPSAHLVRTSSSPPLTRSTLGERFTTARTAVTKCRGRFTGGRPGQKEPRRPHRAGVHSARPRDLVVRRDALGRFTAAASRSGILGARRAIHGALGRDARRSHHRAGRRRGRAGRILGHARQRR